MNSAAPPKPGWWLLLTSTVVILLSLFLIALVVGEARRFGGDACIVIGSGLVLVIPTLLTYWQYWGTFRGNASAAFRAGVLLTLMAILTLYMSLFSLQAANILMALSCAFCAWQNLRWYFRLQENLWTTEAPTDHRFSMREIMVATAAVAFMAAVITYVVPLEPRQASVPEVVEHTTRSRAPFPLPRQARDVAYERTPMSNDRSPSYYVSFEFETTESDFLDWAKSGFGSSELKDAEVQIEPVNSFRMIGRYSTQMGKQRSAELYDGWYCRVDFDPWYIFAAFDRKTGRAYYVGKQLKK